MKGLGVKRTGTDHHGRKNVGVAERGGLKTLCVAADVAHGEVTQSFAVLCSVSPISVQCGEGLTDRSLTTCCSRHFMKLTCGSFSGDLTLSY